MNNTKKKTSSSPKSKSSSQTRKSNIPEGNTATVRSKIKNAIVRSRLKTQLNEPSIRKSKLLNVACRNSGTCLALGKYDDAIKTYFSDFTLHSKYVDKNGIKQIGKPSNNGFIYEIPFTRANGTTETYTAYTAFKCAASRSADNLFYEFFVGNHFINTYIKKLPCFVETYGFYVFKNEVIWNLWKNKNMNQIINTPFRDMVFHIDHITNPKYSKLVDTSCQYSKLLSLLIQHFDNFRSIYDETKNNYDNIKYEFGNLMYQVYYPLVVLGNKYTHYDLHSSNVFLYKPFEGKQCIRMKYHRTKTNQIIEFLSEYIVKIIDYGRNYFNNDTTNTQEILKNDVCKERKCKPNCGDANGYSVIQGDIDDPNMDFFNITPNKPNMSHDLRLVNAYKKWFIDSKMFNSITYKVTNGTPELLNPNFAIDKNVCSIFDMVDALDAALPAWNSTKLDKKYDATWTCVAEMNIYDDGRDYDFVILQAPTVANQNANVLPPPPPSAAIAVQPPPSSTIAVQSPPPPPSANVLPPPPPPAKQITIKATKATKATIPAREALPLSNKVKTGPAPKKATIPAREAIYSSPARKAVSSPSSNIRPASKVRVPAREAVPSPPTNGILNRLRKLYK